ncbi:molybdate ABC transporter substrate-binding protein [bacterium]|nr:molybdate ABC transporter substrate-binding protein [bacterium]MCI0601438.1 molybdate ABC transporter substrate-binding protein [bacterium]
MNHISAIIFSVVVLLVGTGYQARAEVLVHAAASLADALKETGMLYEQKTGEKVSFNFAASSLLARQIQEGAPGDIFFSADEGKMDGLEKEGLIRKDMRKSLLSNTLVIVVTTDSNAKFSSAADLVNVKGSIAIAEPQTVPAGIYAREYLKKIGIWDKVMDRLIPTDNVRASLAAVESGNVDAGIVYKTDAGVSKRVRIAHEIPRGEGPKISYPLAVLTHAKDFHAAKKFYDFLLNPRVLDIYLKYGFLLSDS